MIKAKSLLIHWVLISLFVFALDLLAAIHLIKQASSKNYLQVSGVVEKSSMNYSSVSSEGRIISFRYEVDGKKFVGGRFRYIRTDEMGDLLLWPTQGQVVTVFYNQSNPDDAILSPGIKHSDYRSLPVLGLVNVTLVLAWVFWVSWNKSGKSFKPYLAGNPDRDMPV